MGTASYDLFWNTIVECRAPVVVARVGSTGRIIMALSTISPVENVAGQESREKPDFDPFVNLWCLSFPSSGRSGPLVSVAVILCSIAVRYAGLAEGLPRTIPERVGPS
jgi:hypothetical protein